MDTFDSPDDIIHRRRPDIPITCFRPAALDSAARWFLENLPGKVLYAVKSNPAPHVVEGLFQSGIRHFDAASISEIRMVHDTLPGAFIAFMHPVKSRAAIEQSYFDLGVRDFALDSMGELEKIVSATGASKDLSLIIRMGLPNNGSGLFMAGKFGAAPQKTAELVKAARKVARRVGISFHVGSQTMDPHAYTSALEITGNVLRSMPRTKVDIIDIGGGFPSAYTGMIPPPLADYAAAIRDGLNRLPAPERYEIWSEPGRALVAESCSTVVRVDLRKGDTLYINDGTFGSLFDAGAALNFRFPVRLVRPSGKKASATLKPFRFYGPTCTSEDYMPGPFLLPSDIGEGDYIEIGQLGAYGNAMRTGFNGFSEHDTVTVDSPPLMSMYDGADVKEFCVV
jgi:ornithine decarboxylase